MESDNRLKQVFGRRVAALCNAYAKLHPEHGVVICKSGLAALVAGLGDQMDLSSVPSPSTWCRRKSVTTHAVDDDCSLFTLAAVHAVLVSIGFELPETLWAKIKASVELNVEEPYTAPRSVLHAFEAPAAPLADADAAVSSDVQSLAPREITDTDTALCLLHREADIARLSSALVEAKKLARRHWKSSTYWHARYEETKQELALARASDRARSCKKSGGRFFTLQGGIRVAVTRNCGAGNLGAQAVADIMNVDAGRCAVTQWEIHAAASMVAAARAFCHDAALVIERPRPGSHNNNNTA